MIHTPQRLIPRLGFYDTVLEEVRNTLRATVYPRNRTTAGSIKGESGVKKNRPVLARSFQTFPLPIGVVILLDKLRRSNLYGSTFLVSVSFEKSYIHYFVIRGFPSHPLPSILSCVTSFITVQRLFLMVSHKYFNLLSLTTWKTWCCS